MNTKLLYVLSTSNEDTYYESALISIFSAKSVMPNSWITLLIDDKTDLVLKKKGDQLLQYISEIIIVKFKNEITKKVRSRLLKTNMRNHVSGDFLYIDCDTLIADSLTDIKDYDAPVAAVLDGHLKLNNHPVFDLFEKQNKYFDYPFEDIERYYSSGVIYSKDCTEAKDFFSRWHENYKIGLQNGISQDQPSFSKTNYDSNDIIKEISGEWNCQIRLGGKYLKNLKILHFWSKRNMPISYLGSKEYLLELKEEGLSNKHKDIIRDYESTFFEPMGIVVNSDMQFNFSPLYEEVRQFYTTKEKQYLFNFHQIHNKLFEECTKTKLSMILYKINKAIIKMELALTRVLTKPNRREY
jgi:hypothetical protein